MRARILWLAGLIGHAIGALTARATESELIWQNGFESADTCAWTSTEPATTCDPEMIFLPAGIFTMGSDGNTDEQPVHVVYVSDVWLDRTEVTVDAYADCVAAGECAAPNDSYANDTECNWGAPGRGDHPVNCIDWVKSQSFCAWSGKRFPTEAEWEKAARGTDARTYPWGEASPTCAYTVMNDPSAGGSGCGLNHTAPVGSKPAGASPYGALDMAGNVREWVSDWHSSTYYAESPSENPPGPAVGSERVVRCGSWVNTAFSLRASYRNAMNPSFWGFSYGFRCARSGS